jgi:hypothetical protein
MKGGMRALRGLGEGKAIAVVEVTVAELVDSNLASWRGSACVNRKQLREGTTWGCRDRDRLMEVDKET